MKAGAIDPLEVTYVANKIGILGTIRASWRGHEVGKLLYLEQNSGELLLSEIWVEKRVEIKSGRLVNLMRWFFPNWGCIPARRSRIGTQLLERFLVICAQDGVREVFGNVTPAADRTQPFLRAWYEKLGFKIAPSDGRAEFSPIAYKVVWNSSWKLSQKGIGQNDVTGEELSDPSGPPYVQRT